MFSPDPGEVAFARKILAAMPDGSGAVMIDGKMQDDATWKQARVIVDLARQVAAKDKDFAARLRVLSARVASRQIDSRAGADYDAPKRRPCTPAPQNSPSARSSSTASIRFAA